MEPADVQSTSLRPNTGPGLELEALLGRLQEGSVEERRQAAAALEAYGSRAVEPLCHALADDDREVRIAAVRALGEVGDRHAEGPLTAALRRALSGRSARDRRAAGQLVVAGVVLIWLALLGVTVFFKSDGILGGFTSTIGGALSIFFATRRQESPVCRAISEALSRIAERDPSPEYRALIPELRALAGDRLQQEKATRLVSRDAAERIEALTRKLKSMPLPAAGPTRGTEELPLPATGPVPASESLPRVTE